MESTDTHAAVTQDGPVSTVIRVSRKRSMSWEGIFLGRGRKIGEWDMCERGQCIGGINGYTY